MQEYSQYIKKIILLLVALQVLNIGLFAQDINCSSSNVDTQNIINSVTEYIAEVVLNKADCFSENQKKINHQHHKNHNNFHIKVSHIKLFNCNTTNFLGYYHAFTPKQDFVICNITSFSSIIFDIVPPPPKC
ncbi:MAG: hypothetical protein NTZ59_04015 [Bacteroidetes bacterium]|jgi:hypothetical protein|nr:hypothetical protein [Bacteroidota bacterium]